MEIIQILPGDRQNQKAFIQFPFNLYKQTPQWVPPLRMEMRKIFKPSYAFYNYGEAAFLLAKNDSGKVVGRLVVANNHRYNDLPWNQNGFLLLFRIGERSGYC